MFNSLFNLLLTFAVASESTQFISSLKIIDSNFGQECPSKPFGFIDFGQEMFQEEQVALKFRFQRTLLASNKKYTTSCPANATIQKLQGWKIAITTFEVWGYKNLTDELTKGYIDISWKFIGGLDIAPSRVSKTIENTGAYFLESKVDDPVWSSCDGTSSKIAFYTDINIVPNLPKDDYFSVSQISAFLSFKKC